MNGVKDRRQGNSFGYGGGTYTERVIDFSYRDKKKMCKKVKQSHYRPGQALRVPGG
jgi:hypothetical protein